MKAKQLRCGCGYSNKGIAFCPTGALLAVLIVGSIALMIGMLIGHFGR